MGADSSAPIAAATRFSERVGGVSHWRLATNLTAPALVARFGGGGSFLLAFAIVPRQPPYVSVFANTFSSLATSGMLRPSSSNYCDCYPFQTDAEL